MVFKEDYVWLRRMPIKDYSYLIAKVDLKSIAIIEEAFVKEQDRVKEVIEEMFESRFIDVNTLEPVIEINHDLIKKILLENLGYNEEVR